MEIRGSVAHVQGRDRASRRFLGIITVILACFLCTPVSYSCEPSYQDDLRKICDAPTLSGTSGTFAYMKRHRAMFKWIADNVRHSAAVKLYSAMITAPPELQREMLLGETREQGVTPCPLADWLVKPDSPPGIRLPESAARFAFVPQFVQVSVSPDTILVDETRIADVRQGRASGPWMRELTRKLTGTAKRERALTRQRPGTKVPGTFSLLVDKGILCGLVTQVVQAAHRAGYEPRLVVLRDQGMLGQLKIASLSAEELSSPASERPPLDLAVAIRTDGFVVAAAGGVLATGGSAGGPDDPSGPTIPLATDRKSCKDARPDIACFDYDDLTQKMAVLKDNFPRETRIILLVGPQIPYEVLIRTMDATRAKGDRTLFHDVRLGTPDTMAISREGVHRPAKPNDRPR